MKRPVSAEAYIELFTAKHNRMPTWIPSGEFYVNDYGEIRNTWVHTIKSDKDKYAMWIVESSDS